MTTRRWTAALIIGWHCGLLAAQPADREPMGTILVRGTDTSLWVVNARTDGSQVFLRRVGGFFESLRPLNARIVAVVPVADRLYAVTGQGRFYGLTDGAWLASAALPRDRLPADLYGDARYLYALVRSPNPGELVRVTDDTPPATQPFDPGGAPLSIARYDGRVWTAVAAGPPDLAPDTTTDTPPRLGVLHGRPAVFRLVSDGPQLGALEVHTLANAGTRWESAVITPPLPRLDGFWFVEVAGVPMLVTAAAGPDGVPHVKVYRRLAGDQAEGRAWRPADVQLSPLPPGTSVARYEHATAFNQHLALLTTDRSGQRFVRFGRVEGPPAENTLSVREVVAGRAGPQRGPAWLHSVTLAVMLSMLLVVFLFRRTALAQPATLPADAAIALSFQRMAGALLDLAPFVLGLALVMGVDWRAALRELFAWALGSDVTAGRLPPPRTLTWWAAVAGAYTAYSLTCELLGGRTHGKWLVGTRVLSMNGAPPRPAQTMLRNLARLVELLPPLWVLAFLVVLTRNHQRVGDVLARTVVVRRIVPPTEQ